MVTMSKDVHLDAPQMPFDEGGNRLTPGGHPRRCTEPITRYLRCRKGVRFHRFDFCGARWNPSARPPLLPVQGAAGPPSGVRVLGAGLPPTLL
jgi:hypothetical protein